MPIYVYHCANCDYEFEHSQHFNDPHLKKCPQCGKLTLHKVFTPATIIYKGSGFYSTDHRSASGTPTPAAHKKKDEKPAEKKGEGANEPAKSEPAKSSTPPAATSE